MKERIWYEFSTPNLPTSVYHWLKDCQGRHQVSRWHALIAAIKALRDLEQNDSQKFQEVLAWAKKF